MVREARKSDLPQLLQLYLHLHETSVPEESEALLAAWNQILLDPNHHLLVYERDGKIVSSCVCLIVPNLTRGARPYALLENVVTHAEHRGKGYATKCLHCACQIAQKQNCYKIMLLTGAKDSSTLSFYQKAGFNSTDKTAFIKWL